MKQWINCEVYEVIKETHDTVTLRLTLEESMPFLAGQFVMVAFREGLLAEDPKSARAFSMSSSTENQSMIDITIRAFAEGKVSPELCKCNKGDKLKVRGPYGNFVYHPEFDDDLVLIGAGSGVAPLMSIFRTALCHNPNKEITLMYTDKTKKDFIGRKMFESHIQDDNSNIRLHFTTTRAWFGNRRIDKEMIDEIIQEKYGKLFYICGPPGFVRDIVYILQSKGVEQDKIITEKYD